MPNTAQTDEERDETGVEKQMPTVVKVVATGNEEVLIYPECPYAEEVFRDGTVVRCSIGAQGYRYCTAMRMKPSICPMDKPGNYFR